MGGAPSRFSSEWYRVFLDPIAPASTEAEVALIERQLPPGEFPELLDVCCGPGRHAAALAARGYRVTGVDANPEAIARAKSHAAPGAEFRVLDMRALDSLLRQMGARLRPGGRLVIDVYNRDHLATLPLAETYERNGARVRSARAWLGLRHRVTLEYEGGGRDELEWRLYTPAELAELAAAAGLRVRLACAWFRESLAPSAEHARMQFVLEKP